MNFVYRSALGYLFYRSEELPSENQIMFKHHYTSHGFKSPFRTIAAFVLVSYLLNFVFAPAAQAQMASQLPPAGTMVNLSPAFAPVVIKGIVTYPDNPLQFDFLIDTSGQKLSDEALRQESLKLIKYFLAALTIPEEDMWVNLSPYEDNRIIPSNFSYTDMGKDLLAQDYILKQIAASLIYPEKKIGQEFWEKVYARMGSRNAAVDTLNKVWIVPEDAEVYVRGNSAFIVESRLDVLSDKDYGRLYKGGKEPIDSVGDHSYLDVFKETVLPAIKKDVNYGHNFAPLRQIYNSMILATWYKRNLRETILAKAYVGKSTVNGIDIDDKHIREKIYQQYMEALKKGVYNYIREEYDPQAQTVIPKKYFSGGIELVNFGKSGDTVFRQTSSPVRGQAVKFYDARVVSTQIDVGGSGSLPVIKTARVFADEVTAGVKSASIPTPAALAKKKQENLLKQGPPVSLGFSPKSFNTQWRRVKNILKAFAFASALFVSSFLMVPSLQGATFHLNEEGALVAEVQQGDTAGHILEEMRVAYNRIDGQEYKASLLYGPLWGAKGVAAKQGFAAKHDIRPGERLEFPKGTVSESTLEALTKTTTTQPAVSRQGGEHEDRQESSFTEEAGITRGDDTVPAPAVSDVLPNQDLSGPSSAGPLAQWGGWIQELFSGLKGNGSALIQGTGALGVLLLAFARNLFVKKNVPPRKSLVSSGGADSISPDEFRRQQHESIRKRIDGINPLRTIIREHVRGFLGQLSGYFNWKMDELLNRPGQFKKVIEQQFNTHLGFFLESFVLERFDKKDMETKIDAKARELAAQYAQGALDNGSVVLEIEKFVNEELERSIESGISVLMVQLGKEFLSEDWIKIFQSAIDVQIERFKALDKKDKVEDVAAAAALTIKDLLKKHGVTVKIQPVDIPVLKVSSAQRNENSSKAAQKSLWPEDSIVTLATAMAALSVDGGGVGMFLATGLSPFIYRLGVGISLWVHELGHILRGGLRSVTLANLRGNIGWKQWLHIFVPFYGAVPDETQLHTRIYDTTFQEDKKIRLAGVWTSAAFVLSQLPAFFLFNGQTLNFIFPFSLGAFWTFLQAGQIDLLGQLRGAFRQGVYSCGISAFAQLRKNNTTGIVSEDALGLIEKMVTTTDIRGQQAVGLATQAVNSDGDTVFVKTRLLNGKRGELSHKMSKDFRKKLKQAENSGLEGIGSIDWLISHVRFATQSDSQINETHPHQWMAERSVELWALRNGKLEKARKKLAIIVAHNGDLDYLWLYDDWVPNRVLGWWLERVLHTPNTTVGDSPKIAGTMDFLVTQGIWDASVRLGYYLKVAESLAEVFGGQEPARGAPNTAVSNEILYELGKIFEEQFMWHKNAIMKPGVKTMQETWDLGDPVAMRNFEDAVINRLKQNSFSANWGEKKLRGFVRETIQSFFENDLFGATRKFFDRADHSSNTFGLALGSTLKTDGMVVAARGQPLALGIDEKGHAVRVASEPAAVKIIDEKTRATDRFVLNQELRGEIVEITLGSNAPDLRTPLTVFSRDSNHKLTSEEVLKRYEPLPPFKDNAFIQPLELPDPYDPVGKDIADIPRLIQAIRDDWRRSNSLNLQTADHMLLQLIQKVIEREIKRSSRNYAQIPGQIVATAAGLSAQWVQGLSPAFDDQDAGKLQDILNRQLAPSMQRYMEGLVYSNLNRKKIEQAISHKALGWAFDLLAQTKNENEISYEAQKFVEGELAVLIEEVLQESKKAAGTFAEKNYAYIQSRMVLAKQVAKMEGPLRLENIIQAYRQQLSAIFKEFEIEPGAPLERQGYDIVVTGIEVSLWLGEQFASDLKRLFPDLKIGVTSANKILEDSQAQGIDDNTIVLIISQSGQTFGSLNSAIYLNLNGKQAAITPETVFYRTAEKLEKLSAGRVFVLTGEIDTLMGRAVGQKFYRQAPFCKRIFSNLTGFRPAEAATVTRDATQATLSELLWRLGEGLNGIFPEGKPFHLKFTAEDFAELHQMSDKVIADIERITGYDRHGNHIASAEHNEVIKASDRWYQHVLDVPFSKVITYIHLYISVVFGVAVIQELADLSPWPVPAFIVDNLQFTWFAFFGTMTIWLKRFWDKRTVLARTGNRTIVIGGPPMVHQSLEQYVSKLFALSKAATNVEVHGANPDDHMVHRFAHRIVRGALIWMGLPDGRLSALKRMNNAYMMTARQAMGVKNLGVGAEVSIAGRDRAPTPNPSAKDIIISGPPITDKESLQGLYYNRYETLLQLVIGDVFFWNMAQKLSTFGLPPAFRWLWPWSWRMHRTQSGTRIATTASPQSPPAMKYAPPTNGHSEVPQAISGNGSPENSSSGSKQASSPIQAPGGVDLNSRWLNLKEFVIEEKGLPAPAPVLNDFVPVNRVTPYILDIKPLTPVHLQFFLGLEERQAPSEEIGAADLSVVDNLS